MAQDILITPRSGIPQILFRGSGVNDTAIYLNVLSNYQTASGSGTAVVFEGSEGQLFGITDNLSSGTIFSVGDITGLPIFEIDASGITSMSRYGSNVKVYNNLEIMPSGNGTNDNSALRFYEVLGSGNNYVALKAPAGLAANVTWILPTADGTNGQILSTNGAGILSWATNSGGSVSDGDKGDITVSSTGATWTIDNDVVTNAKMANMAQDTIKGRKTASTGDPEDLSIADARLLLRKAKYTIPVATGSHTLNLDNGLFQKINMSGDMTINFPTSVAEGETCFLYVLKNDSGVNAYTLTFGSGFQTPYGYKLPLASGLTKDRYEMFFDTTYTATLTMSTNITYIT